MALLSIAVVVLLTAWARTWAPRWVARGLALRWPAEITVAAAAAAALAVSIVVHPRYGAAPAAAAAAAAWLGALATSTDLGSRRVPYEACYAVTAIGAGLGLVAAPRTGAITMAAASLGVVGVPAAAGRMLRRGGADAIGRGDIRLLCAWSCCVAWWLGVHPLLVGLLLACVVAAIGRVARALVRRRRSRQPFAPALFLGVVVACGNAVAMGLTPCVLVEITPVPQSCAHPWWSSDAAHREPLPPGRHLPHASAP